VTITARGQWVCGECLSRDQGSLAHGSGSSEPSNRSASKIKNGNRVEIALRDVSDLETALRGSNLRHGRWILPASTARHGRVNEVVRSRFEEQRPCCPSSQLPELNQGAVRLACESSAVEFGKCRAVGYKPPDYGAGEWKGSVPRASATVPRPPRALR
jgi:hypothetical protein